ncbi:TPA_asm: hypothetical protein G4P70_003354 [Salmonella enterica subsp. enterica serovar Worthington]|nr:hypothetical protein [Salmonella enterica subsp. enterica serovar Worthington]
MFTAALIIIKEIVTYKTIQSITHLTVTLIDFSYHHGFTSDNKPPYNHDVKLPDGCFSMIRFLSDSGFSGSVPRTVNKRSGLFRPCAAGQGKRD